ncbi:MAG: dehydrogenase E1 component subunit alpha/beta [Bacteroidia bacterium]
MDFTTFKISKKKQLELYNAIVTPRMIEEKMLKLLRQGLVSKWFSGIGQEAISVGATMALEDDEYIFPLHRNLGVFTSRGIELEQLMHQWQGNPEGFTNSRDRSFHFGSLDHHIVGMISHLAAMLSVADGVSLGNKLSRNNKISLAFCGDGGTSEGEFHEALNLAAVWNLPVLFIIEHNGYGLSTPSSEQFKCENLADKGKGYGIESKIIDGNNILEVYTQVQSIAKNMRKNPKPFLLECKTFRMRGHEEASGTKYVPDDLLDTWANKDPIENYEQYLFEEGILNKEAEQSIKKRIQLEIDKATEIVKQDVAIEVSSKKELADVYASSPPLSLVMKSNDQQEMRFIDAIKSGLEIAMKEYDNLILMGQDIAKYGGVFKITDGLFETYGADRVRNTPISEAAPLGASLGLSIMNYKSMVEMQFADFVSCGFNQIVNNLAKTHYRWGANSDVVIRMPTGGTAAAGPFHSQSNEAWFFHVPGLKIVYPSNPYDAKGLLLRAFNDPNPVMFFEHKALYRTISGNVPERYYEIEIGKASLFTEGEDLSIITYGIGVHWAKEAIEELNIHASILDLRSLLPWDKEAVKDVVIKTSKVLVLHEDTLTGGVGAEIAAWISEHCFEQLDAPVIRVGSLDTPVPFNAKLEHNFMAKARLHEALQRLNNY